MNKDEHIKRLIEASINSTDGMNRATPKPFLLTRISAKLNTAAGSSWERIAAFIGKPVFLIPAFCFIILVNFLVIFNNNTATAPVLTEQGSALTADDFSNTIATFYDTENP